ncbi:MAG: class I mannose-6-phosphate isomerase [Clostridia bacterium]|nr:class I mannose-6-phosphate isomerase [Clostridia bacterium]
MLFYPFLLSSVLKHPLWSGKRLKKKWGKKTEKDTIGESWELSVREVENSVIQNGIFQGRTLGEVITKHPDEILGDSLFCENRFPLLVKLIDTDDLLSVQVHPDDEMAKKAEGDSGKTELWYILEAEEGASILYGFKEKALLSDSKSALENGTFPSLLREIPVKAGEAYFIPAGLPHAIGKGILLAEVQQNSDLTYRLYDFDRLDKNGKARPLHIEKGLAALRSFCDEQIDRLRFAKGKEETNGLLSFSSFFRVEKIEVKKEALLPRARYMRHLLCLSGAFDICLGEERFAVKKGDSYLLPASLPDALLSGEGAFLLSSAPK